MKLYNLRKISLFFLLLLSLLGHKLAAQCGFKAGQGQLSGCAGYILTVQDTTPGSSNTSWVFTIHPASGGATTVINAVGVTSSQLMDICGTVDVKMTNTVGGVTCVSNKLAYITVYCKPVVAGHTDKTVVCTGQSVTYVDQTNPGAGNVGPLTYTIDMGQSPFCSSLPCIKQYQNNGVYCPYVIATNEHNCSASDSINCVTVTPAPTAFFTGTNLSSCASPLISTMTANANGLHTRYIWYVGTGGSFTQYQSSSSPVFSHVYPAGTWDVKLVTEDSLSGCQNSFIQSAYVTAGNAQSGAFVLQSTSNGCIPLTVSLHPLAPSANTYQWSTTPAVGTNVSPTGGTITNANNADVSFTYNAAGTYSIKLKVFDGTCKDSMVMINIVHAGVPPVVSFSNSDTVSCTVPDTARLCYTGPSTGCSFSWTVTAANTGAIPNVIAPNGRCTDVIFNRYDYYTPTLVVTDTLTTCPATLTKTFKYNITKLKATTSVVKLQASSCVNDTLLVKNTTVPGPFASVQWVFGPDATVLRTDSAGALVFFPSTGCHNYRMIVQNTFGCRDTLKDSICVSNKPLATVSVTPLDQCYQYGCNTFSTVIANPTDSPTIIAVWPEGLGNASVVGLNLNLLYPNFTNCYTYQNYGDFVPCYVPIRNGCVGDTVCMIDTVHIRPPAPSFTFQAPCKQQNVVTYTDASRGADSIIWVTNNGSGYVTTTNQRSVTVTYPQCGVKYPISLTAFNFLTGCHVTKNDTTVIPCYGSDFKADFTKLCMDDQGTPIADTIRFRLIDSFDVMPYKFVWDFNAGVNPNFTVPPAKLGKNPSDTITAPGVYKICLQAFYANGCIDTICKSKYINVSQPLARFTTSDSAGCRSLTSTFTNTSTDNFGQLNSWCFNFGGGGADTCSMNSGFSVSHTFPTVNVYTVTLTVTDTNNCIDRQTQNIVVNQIQGGFTMSDTITCTQTSSPLNPIQFISTSTGINLRYQWQFPPDATNITSPLSSTTSAQFTTEGIKQVCLHITDELGACDTTLCKTLRVKNPVADYTITDATHVIEQLRDTSFNCPPGPVRFADRSLFDIDTSATMWNFGDGSNPDYSLNADHIYRYPGCYPVTHMVTSNHGCQNTITKYQICLDGPQISMTASSRGGCPCYPVTFYIRSSKADSIIFLTGGVRTRTFYNGVDSDQIYLGFSPVGSPTAPRFDTLTITYCSPGTVRPAITAIDRSGNCSVYYDSLIVPLVVDSFSASFKYQVKGCGTDSVCFTNATVFASEYAFTQHESWDYGDGSPIDTTRNPCHHFNTPGVHTITLAVLDNVGCTDTITSNIYIPVPPKARFTVDDTIGCRPLALQFRDSSIIDDSTYIASGFWNFGDVSGGVYNTFRDTTYTYFLANTPPNKYTVTLVVRDTFGCTDTARRQIEVHSPPTVNHESPITICLGDTASLNGSGSDTLRWLTYYNISDTISPTPKVWPSVDTVYVLQVGHENRCYVFDSVVVNVSSVTALDTVLPVCLNQSSVFNGSTSVSTHSPISSYTWYFGDGTPTGSGISTAHLYAAYNTYQDTLIVVNSIGCRDTAYGTAIVYDLPHALLSVSDSSVCLGTCVTLTSLSTPGASTGIAQTNFDAQNDGVIDYTTSPSVACYTSTGNYTARLIVIDNNQCRDTADKRVVVHTIPVASFNNDSNCINSPNLYISNSILGDGSLTHYQWTVNGTVQPVDSNLIEKTYTVAGTNTVCLRVTDVYGCFDDTCKLVSSFASALDTVSPLDTTICVGYSAGFNVTGTFDRVEWVPTAWVDNPNSPNVVITPKQTIRYNVLSYYKQCPPKVDTVNIWVIDSVPVSASADPQNIVLGLSSNVTSTVKGTIDSIVWDPDSTLSCRSCRNPIATPSATTTYTATVYYSKNKVTCSNRTQVTITVFRSCDNSLIYIPNTFTPNNDGNNDVFRIRGQGITKVNYFRVFDRWGKIVYEANNVDDTNDAAWNGCFNNDKTKPVNSDVFVYLFEVECVTGQKINGKGNVTLIR